ncbi:MAG: hypothetical protein LQ338_002896 [Usnochroma carphineum]|nr:MAG: hypothetical protein LQ338_002896 [Usnochroma carphineum]
MSFRIPESATRGFANASSYDTHRPSYLPEAVDNLLSRLQVKGIKNSRIIDVGAGTGKFSEVLAKRDEEFEIVAVEPHDEMRRECEAKGLRGVKVEDGMARSMPVETEWADAVVVAQVGQIMNSPVVLKHWFATDETLEEICRVLIPGGHLGMIWNVEDCAA